MQSIQFSAYFVPRGGYGCQDTTKKLNREYRKTLAKLPTNLELVYHRQWSGHFDDISDGMMDSITLQIKPPTLWQRFRKSVFRKGRFIQTLPSSLSGRPAFLRAMTTRKVQGEEPIPFASQALDSIIKALFNTVMPQHQQRLLNPVQNPKTAGAKVQG